MSKDRQSGFYWVEIYGEWTIGYWIKEHSSWDLPGYIPEYEDKDFSEIDERPIVREEPKKGNWTGIKGTTERIPQP